MSQDALENQPPSQNQTVGDVQVQGNDNVFNVIQGNDVLITLNQTRIIQVSVDEIKTRKFVSTSPYKGLRTFEPEDRDQFFGRDQFLTGLVNELEQTNLVLLLGASGSGKSSVVRAGLIPWLSQKWGTRLVNLTVTPDQDPFESLYCSLQSRYRQSEVQFVRAGKVDTLSQLVRTLKQPESFWFLLIDQFEELFTTSDPEKRDRFITSVVQLSQEQVSNPLLKIVATMRADFLDRLDPAPANRLARATDKHRPLMTQMQPDELRLAIEQPAAHRGVVYETGLVETIIKDVQGQAGYLPLLQYTLNRLWETEQETTDFQQERMLCTRTYLQLGGVRGTLQSHVDRIYERLQQEEKHLATQRIFLKLVEIGGDAESGADWKPVRRRANRSEFKDEEETLVLAQLIDEKLVVSDRDLPSQAQESTVEIAHEILLTSWTTLNTWIKENRQVIALRNRLNDDVRQWQATKPDDELWGGSKLARVVELKNDPLFHQILGGFSPEAMEFIAASVGLRDHLENEKEAQRQRELETQIRLRKEEVKARRAAQNRTRVVIIASVFILGFAILAGLQWRQAEIGQISALTQSSEAKFALNRNSFDALLKALESASRLKRLPGDAGSELHDEVMTTLGQAVNWVMETNRLEGHQGNVQDVRFSPDGQTIVTAGYDNTVKFWHPDGKLICTVEGHTGGAMSVGFSPNGKMVASAGNDQKIKLWNRDCHLLRTIKGHKAAVYSVSFSPDGQTLISGSADKTVKLWSLNGNLLRSMVGHTDAIRTVKFSPDGETIASASVDHTTRLWDTRTGQWQQTLQQKAGVWSLGFSPNGQTITTGDEEGAVKLWNHQGELEQTLKGHAGIVKGISFSPDGHEIVTTGDDGTVKLWRYQEEALVESETLIGHTTTVNNAIFSPDGTRLASASHDKTVKLWKLKRQVLLFHTGHQGVLYTVHFSPDGQTILTASDDKTAKLFTRGGTLLKTFTEHSKAVTDANFSPTGQTIATGSGDHTVKLFTRNGTLLKTLIGHDGTVFSVSFSPDGQTLATASKDKTVKLWNMQGREDKTLRGHQGWVYTANFSPNGQLLVTASEDHTAKLWRRDGPLVKTLAHGDSAVYNAVFRPPDGQMIATASQDNTAKLWDLNGKILCTFNGHTDGINGASFSPDGQILATASNDKTIKLWNVNDCSLMMTLTGHQTEVFSVNFSPDGKSLVSVGEKDVIVWNVNALDLDGLLFKGCLQISDYLKTNANPPMHLCSTVRK